MKDLYQPVFWCGFALSLSALYAGAEKLAADSEGSIQEPVLMQISVGEPAQSEVDLGTPGELQETDGEFQSPVHPSTGSEIDLTPPLPHQGSAFFEAAKAAMESP